MLPIEAARIFVREKVQIPALSRSDLPKAIRDKVAHSDVWLKRFQRVGDLLAYLRRFDIENDDPLYKQLKELGLLTFEDIVDEFENKFEQWANDSTRPSDFVIGDCYSAYQILILTKTYDTRAGGMFVLASNGAPSGVVIKASLNGGHYPNEWLEKPVRLKYYLKAIKGDFGEHFKTNATILNNSDMPILTFVREDSGDNFTYAGVFYNKKLHREVDGSKWFDLHFAKNQPADALADASFIERTFASEVATSSSTPREQRLARLKNAPKKPAQISVVTTAFIRNPDVVAETLFLANGICGNCHEPAPFTRKADGKPYLEVHHRVPLAAGGEDTVENAVAICPNCHRKAHFG